VTALISAEERCVARGVEPPADAESAGEHEVAEAALSVDGAAEGDVLERLRVGVAPAQGADGSNRAVFVDAEANLGAFGRQVEASHDDVSVSARRPLQRWLRVALRRQDLCVRAKPPSCADERYRVEALVNRCRRDAPPGFLTRVIAFA
jgi:hypothetical protein